MYPYQRALETLERGRVVGGVSSIVDSEFGVGYRKCGVGGGGDRQVI
jgi:hypothetical protein